TVPAVAGGVVYWGSATGTFYALDAATGTTLWSTPIYIAGLVGPAVVDGVVYVGGADGTVHALDAATGLQLWSYDTGAIDIGSSPAVANGVVYVAPGPGTMTSLVALDAASGTLLWGSEV